MAKAKEQVARRSRGWTPTAQLMLGDEVRQEVPAPRVGPGDDGVIRCAAVTFRGPLKGDRARLVVAGLQCAPLMLGSVVDIGAECELTIRGLPLTGGAAS